MSELQRENYCNITSEEMEIVKTIWVTQMDREIKTFATIVNVFEQGIYLTRFLDAMVMKISYLTVQLGNKVGLQSSGSKAFLF